MKPLLYLDPRSVDTLYYINGFKSKDILPYLYSTAYPTLAYGLAPRNFDQVFDTTNTVPEGRKFFYPLIISQSQVINVIHQVNIPRDVIEKIKAGQCKILLVSTMEGWKWSWWNAIMDPIKAKFNLSSTHFVLITGNHQPNHEVTKITYNYWESFVYNSLGNKAHLDTITNKLDNIRKHKFICLNRRPAWQRYATVTSLYDLKDQGILTCAKSASFNPEYVAHEERSFKIRYPQLVEKFDRYVKPNIPLTYNDGVDPEVENPAMDSSTQKFFDSSLYIVTETFVDGDGSAFLSEKAFKPIVFGMPFIIIGQPRTLELMKSLGYRTFSPYINESYDTIEDDNLRVIAAIESAKKVIAMSSEELLNLMQAVKPIILHNYHNLKNRQEADLDQLTMDLLNSL